MTTPSIEAIRVVLPRLADMREYEKKSEAMLAVLDKHPDALKFYRATVSFGHDYNYRFDETDTVRSHTEDDLNALMSGLCKAMLSRQKAELIASARKSISIRMAQLQEEAQSEYEAIFGIPGAPRSTP